MVNTTGDEEVGRFRRVPVVLGRSWPLLLIALMIVFLAGEELTPRVIRKATLETLLWGGCLLVSVGVHEVGHLLAAQLLGVPMRRIHVDVWGGHLTHVPVPRSPGVSMVIAVAGPLLNLVVAYVAWLNRDVAYWSLVIGPLMVINALLFVYNMLPGLPQDGGHLVGGVVWWLTGNRTSGLEVGAWSGRFVVVTVVLAWIGLPLKVSRSLPRLVDLLWLVPVCAGMWIWTTIIVRVARRRKTTDRIRLRDIAKPTMTVPMRTRLDIVDASFPAGSGVIVLDDQQRPVGLLAVGADSVPGGKRDVRTAGDVMAPMDPVWESKGDLEAAASEQADLLHHHRLPVVAVQLREGRWGLVWRADVENAVNHRASLLGPRRAAAHEP